MKSGDLVLKLIIIVLTPIAWAGAVIVFFGVLIKSLGFFFSFRFESAKGELREIFKAHLKEF